MQRAFVCFLAFSSTGFCEVRDELVNFILAEHERVREQLGTYHLTATYTSTFEMNLEPAEVTATLDEYARDKELWYRAKWQRSRPSVPEGESWTKTQVINKDYSAFWREGNANAYIFDHDSIDTIHETAASELGTARPVSVLEFVLGTGRISLRNDVQLHPDVFAWDTENYRNKEGHDLVVVRRHSPFVKASSDVDIEYVVDPTIGYVVTNVIVRDKSGNVSYYAETRYSKNEHGEFAPVSASSVTLKEDSPLADMSTPAILSGDFLSQIDPSHVAIGRDLAIEVFERNPQIPQRQFEWGGLGVNEDTFVIRQYVGGQEEVFKPLGGAILQTLAAELTTSAMLDMTIGEVANADGALKSGEIQAEKRIDPETSATPKPHQRSTGIVVGLGALATIVLLFLAAKYAARSTK